MACEGCLCRCHLRKAQCVTEVDPAHVAAAMADLLRRPVRLPLRAAG
jgi:hypothetical protein